MRILLVDDNADHRFLAKRALAALAPELPLDVEVADDGEEAVERLADETRPLPDLLLLDIKMPRRDGFQVLEAVRGSARTNRLIVVMMTSSENAADVARARALGADDYVTKEMDPRAFRAAVHDVVRRWAAHLSA